MIKFESRDGVTVTRLVHIQNDKGSNPFPATTHGMGSLYQSTASINQGRNMAHRGVCGYSTRSKAW